MVIKPNSDKGTITKISNSTGEESYKANQFIKSDSYSLKAMTSIGTEAYTVSRIDGRATVTWELSKNIKRF